MAQRGGTEVKPAFPISCSNGAEGLVRPRKLEFTGQSTRQETWAEREHRSTDVPPRVFSRVLSSACL